MIHEISCMIGYQCSCCSRVFEWQADAYTHDQWCGKKFRGDNRIKAEKQMASIKLETYKPDGSRAGIVLSEPEPIEIVPDLIQMRRSLKNLVGNWS